MNKKLIAYATALLLMVSCNEAANNNADADDMEDKAKNEMPTKAQVQEWENNFAAADNKNDANAIGEMYADDAVSYGPNKPPLSGKENIRKDVEAQFAGRAAGGNIAFDVLDVYGDNEHLTEVGKITSKDSTGNVTYSGHYIAIWENRDGKWVCIRDMSASDMPAKK